MKPLIGPCRFDDTKLSPRGYHQRYREIYVQKYGPVPKDLQLDHICCNKACCNPEHLEPVTCLENIKRAPKHNINKTHCPRGHEYTTENTYIFKTKTGSGKGRSCKECKSLRGCF